MDISPDNRLVCVADGPVVSLWDPRSLNVMNLDAFTTATVSRLQGFGDLVSVGDEYGRVLMGDTCSMSVMEIGDHEGPITALSFSCDESILGSGSKDGDISLWDVKHLGQLKQCIVKEADCPSFASSLLFTSSGDQLFTGLNGSVARVPTLGFGPTIWRKKVAGLRQSPVLSMMESTKSEAIHLVGLSSKTSIHYQALNTSDEANIVQDSKDRHVEEEILLEEMVDVVFEEPPTP